MAVLITTAKVVATHLPLYLVTHFVLDFVEDNLTPSGTVALGILAISIPLSFMLNLWAVGGLAEHDRNKTVRAALLTGLISPFSAMLWLTLYVNVVGYDG